MHKTAAAGPLRAPVNRILEHTLVDGPGNRTIVFFQECNIGCRYCHNPETQRMCIGCGSCVDQCPAGALRLEAGRVIWDRELCVGCDTCIHVCPHYSSPKVTEMTVDEVYEEIRRNIPFIRGITVSGGECSLRLPFLQELFARCRNLSLTCLMDCNGTVPLWDEPVMEVCDGVMLDVKAWDEGCFRRLTGAGNSVVKENLRHLSEMEKLEELRIVCLDGWVDAPEVIRGIAQTVTEKTKRETLLKLIRFRSMGVRGELAKAPSPSGAYMAELEKLARQLGFENIRVV